MILKDSVMPAGSDIKKERKQIGHKPTNTRRQSAGRDTVTIVFDSKSY